MLGIADALAHALDVAPDDAVVVPGHGALSTMAALLQYYEGLRATIQHVRAARARGLALAEIQRAETSGEVELFLGTNPNRMIEAIYRSIE